MRLINTEELDVISWTATGRAEYDKGYEDGVNMVADKIDSAPTVDAVPVEWFYEMIYACGMQGQINAVAAMNWVLDEWKATKNEWQKEQEAR